MIALSSDLRYLFLHHIVVVRIVYYLESSMNRIEVKRIDLSIVGRVELSIVNHGDVGQEWNHHNEAG